MPAPPKKRSRLPLSKAQLEFRRSNDLFRGFVGGRGAGKSWVGAYDLIRRARKGCTYLIASPTGVKLQDETYPTFERIAKGLGAWRSVKLSPYPNVTLYNKAVVRFRSAEDPEKMRGPNLSGVWLDEASLMIEAAYLISIACLREEGRMGWLSATFTPKGRSHWTFDTFATGRANTAIFQAPTSGNPFLPPEFYETLKGQYTSSMAAQELSGEFMDPEGALFKRQWFDKRIVDAAPSQMTRVRAWDLAATEPKDNTDPDYTVGCLMGKTPENVYYVEDIQRVMATPHAVEQLIRATAERDGRSVPVQIEQEPGASGIHLIDHYVRRVLQGYAVRGEKSTGDKVTRAMPFAAQVEHGNVYFLRGRWLKEFIDELTSFPSEGIHDDQCDAASACFERLSRGRTAQVW